MKPLFKHILLKVEKQQKKEDLDDFFSDKTEKKLRSEATLVGFAHDCDDIVHTLMEKKVLWNGRFLETVEETEEYKVVLAEENVLIAML